MRKDKSIIWYDWNNSSGFELLETSKEVVNSKVNLSKTDNIIESSQYKIDECNCNCSCKLNVVL